VTKIETYSFMPSLHWNRNVSSNDVAAL